MDDAFPDVLNEIMAFKRQGEAQVAEIPVFDQHISLLTSFVTRHPFWWTLPLGVVAVGLHYRDTLGEYFDLVYGLVSNIADSVSSNSSIILFIRVDKANYLVQNG